MSDWKTCYSRFPDHNFDRFGNRREPMMFVLVRVRDERVDLFAPFIPFRATHAADGKAIDLFFWALGTEGAKSHVRRLYRSAVFSDD